MAQSRATLIIAPNTLIGQWERELRDKHVAGEQLRILKIVRPAAAEWNPFAPANATSSKPRVETVYEYESRADLRDPLFVQKVTRLVRENCRMFD